MFRYKPNIFLHTRQLSLSQTTTLTMTTITYAGKYQDDYNRLMNLVPSCCKGKKGKGRTTRSKVSRPFSFNSVVTFLIVKQTQLYSL